MILSFKQFLIELRSNETLKSFLEPTHPYVGDEKIEWITNRIQVRKDKYGSYRFMKLNDKDRPIAVVQVVSQKKNVGHVSNVFVDPEYRRKGIATEIMSHVKQMFKKLTYSDDRSDDGKDFVASVEK
jgi:GNAT superfamily N-acetyltransferase